MLRRRWILAQDFGGGSPDPGFGGGPYAPPIGPVPPYSPPPMIITPPQGQPGGGGGGTPVGPPGRPLPQSVQWVPIWNYYPRPVAPWNLVPRPGPATGAP